MIRLRSVSKDFRLYKRPSDRLLEWCRLGRHHQIFSALRNINLEVAAGRTTGIVGANGAGKSTLLKLIAGTLMPTKGTVEISGRVAALLELGTGFHPDFSGWQNIYINGQLLGLTLDEIKSLEPKIIEFSELGAFIYQPIRTYSSGMVMRLGFAIAASVNPDVLIVDEALSVGDARFAQKCTQRIREFRDKGTTILFVSHDPAAITTLCDEAVLLEEGQIRTMGAPRDILDEYNALLAAKGSGNLEMRITRSSKSASGIRRHGTFQALITRLQTLRPDQVPTDTFKPGESAIIRLRVVFLTKVENPTVGFVIKDRLGLNIYGTNTALKKLLLGKFDPGDYADVDMTLPLNLGYGDYHITVAVHQDETHLETCFEWTDNAAVFKIRLDDKPDWSGLLMLEATLNSRSGTATQREIEESLIERFGDLEEPLRPSSPPPVPFLYGFDALSFDEMGERRLIRGMGIFVYRPTKNFLRLRLGVIDEWEHLLPVEYELSLPCRRDAASVRGKQTDQYESLVFELAPELVGTLTLFKLLIIGNDAGRTVALYEISSISDPEENVAWPVKIPAKLS